MRYAVDRTYREPKHNQWLPHNLNVVADMQLWRLIGDIGGNLVVRFAFQWVETFLDAIQTPLDCFQTVWLGSYQF